MPYELFIALRYLRAKRKQAMISVITLIAISAVAAGVASLITVLSLMTGFREEVQTRILSGTAHINLLRKDGAPLENYRDLEEKLMGLPHVRAAAATLYQPVLIQGQQDSSGAFLKGVDLAAPREANEVFQFLVEGNADDLARPEVDPETGAQIDQMIVGRDLAQTVGLKVGDIASVLSPQGHLTPMGMAPRYKDFRVAGIFAAGLADYDLAWAYVSLEAAARLSGREGVAQLIQLKVDDIYDVKSIGRGLLSQLGSEYTVTDWEELNAPLYTMLSYEKLLSGIALLIVIGIAALNIITVLVMMVIDKRKDIAILKSMGATSRSVMALFIIEGLMLGLIGMTIGATAGTVACYLANSRQLIKLPAGIYALGYLPFHIHWADVAVVAGLTVLISFVSTLYPSWSASRLDPVEALRYE